MQYENVLFFIYIHPSASNKPAIYSIFNLVKYISSNSQILFRLEHFKYNSSFSLYLFDKFANLLNLYKH